MLTQTDNQLNKEKTEKERSPSPKMADSTNSNLSVKFSECMDVRQVLSLEDLSKVASECDSHAIGVGLSICRLGKLSKGKMKRQRLRIQPIYREILDYIRDSEFFLNNPEDPNWKSIHELYSHFSSIKPRTLRSYLKELQQLKWLRRYGRDYHLNPFLYVLFKDNRNLSLLNLAPYKIDLFELLNLPLINALKRKVTNVSIRYFATEGLKIFKGLVAIELTLDKNQKACTYLPVNVHTQAAKGKDIEHNCIPLSWKLFDIDRAAYYSTDFKRSHHKGAQNRHNEFIHFDNSITVRYLPRKQIYMLWEKKAFQQKTTSIKHWQTGEYLEYDNLDNLRRLFVERFVNGKRFLDLFNALGMTYKPNNGRPKGCKNKPKFNYPTIKPTDLLALMAKENANAESLS